MKTTPIDASWIAAVKAIGPPSSEKAAAGNSLPGRLARAAAASGESVSMRKPQSLPESDAPVADSGSAAPKSLATSLQNVRPNDGDVAPDRPSAEDAAFDEAWAKAGNAPAGALPGDESAWGGDAVDPLDHFHARPEQPSDEAESMDDYAFTPEELAGLEFPADKKSSAAAEDVDDFDSASESDSASDSDTASPATVPKRVAGDPVGGTSPAQATPGQKLTRDANRDALENLFGGRADAADLIKNVEDAPPTARVNITDFAMLLNMAKSKTRHDKSLSPAEQKAALAEMDGLAEKYIALIKTDGLGKKSAFGVYYNGHYQDVKTIKKLTQKLGELSGSRTAAGCEKLCAQMLEMYIDPFLRNFVEQKYGGAVDLTDAQLRGLVDFQAGLALDKVGQACQEIAQKNDKSIRAASKMLMLLTAIPDLLRGEEDVNAAKAAQAKNASKKAPAADPNAVPAPAADPASSPAAASNAAPGTVNNYYGPVIHGNIENSFNRGADTSLLNVSEQGGNGAAMPPAGEPVLNGASTPNGAPLASNAKNIEGEPVEQDGGKPAGAEGVEGADGARGRLPSMSESEDGSDEDEVAYYPARNLGGGGVDEVDGPSKFDSSESDSSEADSSEFGPWQSAPVDLLGPIDPAEAEKLQPALGSQQQDLLGSIDAVDATSLPPALQATKKADEVHGNLLQMPAVALPHKETKPAAAPFRKLTIKDLAAEMDRNLQEFAQNPTKNRVEAVPAQPTVKQLAAQLEQGSPESVQQAAESVAPAAGRPTVRELAAGFEKDPAEPEQKPMESRVASASGRSKVKQLPSRFEPSRELRNVDFLMPRGGKYLANNYRNLDTGVETTVLRRTQRWIPTPKPQQFVQPTIFTQPVRPAPAAAPQP
ncbi:MAG TPA: hypothetical protein VGN04_18110 [Herbaspirillum sp.]|jgi:hypothetical protein